MSWVGAPAPRTRVLRLLHWLLSSSRLQTSTHSRSPRRCDHEAAQRSVCRLAHLPGWTRLRPNHDSTAAGLSRAEVAALAARLPACAT